MNPLGYAWLVRHLGLLERPHVVSSQLGTRLRTKQGADGSTQREYPPQYEPEQTIAGHLEFALKYDGVDLCTLRDVFLACGAAPIEEAIRARPTSRYTRLLGFFYELTTGRELAPTLVVGGNYIEALPVSDYLVSPTPRRNVRWRVRDNLLGDARYCPTIRRTAKLAEAPTISLQDELQGLLNDFPPELFQRAADYLYLKETRSTYGIEHEAMPTADRTQRFVALLRAAGEGILHSLLSETELVKHQNLIVDPRYAASSFRAHQNYVGEQRPDYSQRIHYACPPPQFVASLMVGLADSAERCAGLSAVARAAAVAFGFIFIHPFEDGNGRLHRFLIHDILHRDGFIAHGVMLPVSATMLRRMRDYDAALEKYSRPLMSGLVRYDLDPEGSMTISNPDQVEGYYRFPDLTSQVEYLAETVAFSIREDFAEELRFLRSYDAARKSIQQIIDIPDRRLDLLLRLLYQNGGRLSQAKRELFTEVSNEELARIEKVFAENFSAKV